jgi:hypothetical protein
MHITLQGYLAVFSPKNYDHFPGYLQFKFELKWHKLKKSYIATIRDKWPSPIIGHPMRSTYQENCSGAMLTFIPSARLKKTRFLH